ncbi:uncharacterized protein LACBIDRAFT_335664 [Laccaria bicolor S238N-H82]|uniref:Predicted protein n=1 Tax=Laccaria bicolor (strain S238N-H82 / ATCC MYA-4686) TaxID=486041 RepID=B0E303_LACBS|nr:uncharacterized protein LACBIDRAFT_335664 [Laccaria bicolor S238N-H82]EDQ98782.1 predicted protein [Laccaria bicolor S238N-H82]|eukprot:XP_001890571.1 predicted protein [Laccaria bicolor S238N-H82]
MMGYLGKPILGLHYDPENGFFAPFQNPKYKFLSLPAAFPHRFYQHPTSLCHFISPILWRAHLPFPLIDDDLVRPSNLAHRFVYVFLLGPIPTSSSHQLLTNHHLLKYPSTSIHINLTYLSNMSRRLRSVTISTKENVPDLAPPKRGRRASVHASSTPDFQVAEPVAPFTQANDTGNQEDGQTQVKYGPPKKKTAIHAPANDAATQEVGKTQVKSGPPKKKTVAAVEGQRRPSNAQVFDGVHIQARVQLSRNVATEAAVRPANDPASEAAGHPDAVRSGVVGPGHVPHKSKPAPVLRTYGRKALSAQPTAPAAIATNAGNSDHTLSDLTPTCSDEDDITLPDQPEGANSYSSFDVNDLPSTGRELTSIRDEDFHPRSLTIHDLDYDEVQEIYADKTTQYYHGREMTEGCQTAADWFTKYLDDDTKQWLPIPQGFTAPHLPENYVDALNILREEDELHVNSYVIEPWDGGHHHYQGSLPQRGEQDAADRLIQVFLEDSEEYVPIPEGYTAPREPYDHIDALNWEKIAHERARHRQILASQGVPESDISGSDWELAELFTLLHLFLPDSYWTPRFLLDSYWTGLGLGQFLCWLITIQFLCPSPSGVLVNSYWNGPKSQGIADS